MDTTPKQTHGAGSSDSEESDGTPHDAASPRQAKQKDPDDAGSSDSEASDDTNAKISENDGSSAEESVREEKHNSTWEDEEDQGLSAGEETPSKDGTGGADNGSTPVQCDRADFIAALAPPGTNLSRPPRMRLHSGSSHARSEMSADSDVTSFSGQSQRSQITDGSLCDSPSESSEDESEHTEDEADEVDLTPPSQHDKDFFLDAGTILLMIHAHANSMPCSSKEARSRCVQISCLSQQLLMILEDYSQFDEATIVELMAEVQSDSAELLQSQSSNMELCLTPARNADNDLAKTNSSDGGRAGGRNMDEETENNSDEGSKSTDSDLSYAGGGDGAMRTEETDKAPTPPSTKGLATTPATLRKKKNVRAFKGTAPSQISHMRERYDIHGFVAGIPGALRLVRCAIVQAFDQGNPNLEAIPRIASDFLTVLSGLTTSSSERAGSLRSTADMLEATTPPYSDQLNYGDLMAGIDKAFFAMDVQMALRQDSELWLKALTAMHHYKFGDKVKVNLNALSAGTIAEFTEVKKCTNSLSMFVLRLATVLEACSNWTIDELYSHLKHGRKKLLSRASRLFKAVRRQGAFDEKVVTIKWFIVNILLPSLAKGEEVTLAVEVACDMKKYMSETSGKKRRKLFNEKITAAQRKRANGDGEYQGKDFFGGCDSDTWRESVTLTFNFVLGPQIEAEFPRDTFTPLGGYGHTILCGAWHPILRIVNTFPKRTFFAGGTKSQREAKKKKITAMKNKVKALVNEGEEERVAIVVFDAQQMKSLEGLLAASESFP